MENMQEVRDGPGVLLHFFWLSAGGDDGNFMDVWDTGDQGWLLFSFSGTRLCFLHIPWLFDTPVCVVFLSIGTSNGNQVALEFLVINMLHLVLEAQFRLGLPCHPVWFVI